MNYHFLFESLYFLVVYALEICDKKIIYNICNTSSSPMTIIPKIKVPEARDF